jgi:AcrR family transcriptional regulator
MCCGTRAEIYDPLLAAADELVTTNGPEVALDEIARRAGVANATLYRHFPDGRDLLVAVCVSEVKALCTLGEQLDQNPDAGQALTRWLRAYITRVSARHGSFIFKHRRGPCCATVANSPSTSRAQPPLRLDLIIESPFVVWRTPQPAR